MPIKRTDISFLDAYYEITLYKSVDDAKVNHMQAKQRDVQPPTHTPNKSQKVFPYILIEEYICPASEKN